TVLRPRAERATYYAASPLLAHSAAHRRRRHGDRAVSRRRGSRLGAGRMNAAQAGGRGACGDRAGARKTDSTILTRSSCPNGLSSVLPQGAPWDLMPATAGNPVT